MSVATRNPFALLDGRLLLFYVILSLTFTYKQRTGHPLLPLRLRLLHQHPLHNHNQLVVVDAEALPLVVADTTSVEALHPLLVPLRLMTNQLQSQNQGDVSPFLFSLPYLIHKSRWRAQRRSWKRPRSW
jgi:hypothetical protein